MQVFLLCLLIAISGCKSSLDETYGLTPLPSDGPSDEILHAVIKDFFLLSGAPRQSSYDIIRVDVNDDGKRDALVYIKLPHNHWCGWGGCTMVVFQAGDERFSLVSQISNIRGPIIVSPKHTNGWKDIIVRLTGMTDYDRTIRLPFDGSSYPKTPSALSPIPYDFEKIIGEQFFL